MKRMIKYRGVEAYLVEGRNKLQFELDGIGYFAEFSEFCDMVDQDLIDQFDKAEHKSRSQRVAEELVGKKVVAVCDGGYFEGVLSRYDGKFYVGIAIFLDREVNDCEVFIVGEKLFVDDLASYQNLVGTVEGARLVYEETKSECNEAWGVLKGLLL